MTNANTTTVPALVLKRTYQAPRERVYAAWTSPDVAAKFMGPGEVKATNVQMDVRPGGKYSITMLLTDGDTMIVSGTYREVRAPERLSMTWRWQEDDPKDEYDSLLTLEFNDLGGATELILTHDGIRTVESRGRHEGGWTKIVDQLSRAL